jgi:hypothetical protein
MYFGNWVYESVIEIKSWEDKLAKSVDKSFVSLFISPENCEVYRICINLLITAISDLFFGSSFIILSKFIFEFVLIFGQ